MMKVLPNLILYWFHMKASHVRVSEVFENQTSEGKISVLCTVYSLRKCLSYQTPKVKMDNPHISNTGE